MFYFVSTSAAVLSTASASLSSSSSAPPPPPTEHRDTMNVNPRRAVTAVTTFFAVTIRPGDGPSDGRAVPRVLVRRVLGRDVRHRRTTAAVRLPGRRSRDHHTVRPDAVQAGDRGRHGAPVRRQRRARPVVPSPRLLQGRGDPAGHENVEAARARRRRNRRPVRRHRRAAQGRLLGAARRPAPPTRLLLVGGPSASAAVVGRGPFPDVLAAATTVFGLPR